jgi:hypothetical protein
MSPFPYELPKRSSPPISSLDYLSEEAKRALGWPHVSRPGSATKSGASVNTPRTGPAGLPPRVVNRVVSLTKTMDNAGMAAIISGVFLLGGSVIDGMFALLAKDSPPIPVVTNCAEQQRQVIDVIRQNPQLNFRYDGPSEDECHLNDIVKRWGEISRKPPGAP